jgi:two-component system OmpR family response regulator
VTASLDVADAPDDALGTLRVLYVDDDRVNGLLFEAACRSVGGVAVTLAETGAEALARATEQAPHLLVLDQNLPDGRGTELLARLRHAIGDERLPAVLCTAELPEDVGPAALAAGFGRCWSKPVEADTLRAELVSIRRAQRAGVGPA